MGPRSAIRRRAAADHKESVKNARPASTRAAGAGGSSGTMLRLYTDESPGLKVDPMVILFQRRSSASHCKGHKEILLDFLGELTGGLLHGKNKSVVAGISCIIPISGCD